MGQISKNDDYKLISVDKRPWKYKDIKYWKNPKDGAINATIEFNGKKSRLRAGILIVKDDEVLLSEEADEKGAFSIPGGGLNEYETPVAAAKREAQEEVHINVKNVIDTEFDYCECHSEVKDWVKENVPKEEWWYNYYTCLIFGEYAGRYEGTVSDVDKDSSMENNKKWYKIKDVIDKPTFKPEWKKALEYFYADKLQEEFNSDQDYFYHGSPICNITSFNTPNSAPEAFFTKSKKYAEEYTYDWETGEKTGCLYTVKLNMKNPLDIDSPIGKSLKKFLNIDDNNVIASDKIYEYLKQKHGVVKFTRKDGTKEQQVYDGIISREELTQKMKQEFGEEADINYIPLNTDQIEIVDKQVFKEINEDLKDDAKDYFGTTWNWRLATYINTDGTLLDGSGEKLGNHRPTARTIDHREIADIFDDSISGSDAMIAYMNEGNIRLKPEAPGFELIKEPTEEQYKAISRLVSYFKDVYYVDIDNNWGEAVLSKEYERFDSPIKDIKNYFANDKALLREDTRTQFIAKSRNAGQYKDQKFGKNRFERKRLSKMANAVKAFNQIDMNTFFKQDTLEVKIPVTGETDSYTVTVRMEGVCTEIAKNIKSNHNVLEFKTILQALTKVFNTANVFVNCTCPDFKYRFDHWSVVRNFGTTDSAHDPGPGKGIANPHDDKGNGCKHVLLVLANLAWIMRVASVINNYIHYAEEKMQKAFLKVIFPKLYGTTAEDAADAGLIPEDTNLETTKDVIDLINDYGRNRGKYQKGSNKNPITNTGGRAKKEPEKPLDKKELESSDKKSVETKKEENK